MVQVFFQDFENKSHTYLKNCVLLLMVIFPAADSRAELYVENLSRCAVWVCPWSGILLLEGSGVLGPKECRRGGVQRGPPVPLPLRKRVGPWLTNCCSLWCSRVPANCCCARLGVSRGSEGMLCCQCWKSVHFDPAVFLICQRLKTLIELSCAGSCVRRTAAACPVDSHIHLSIKQIPAAFHLY